MLDIPIRFGPLSICCPRCCGRVERHQRVMELPDLPTVPETHEARTTQRRRRENESADGCTSGLLSLRSLRAALADVSVGDGVGGSAILLFEQGADPDVAATYPEFAARLAALSVPPAVQRALVGRGFTSWDQIEIVVADSSDVDVLATKLGVASPAAEILLRRFHSAATEKTTNRRALRRIGQSDKRVLSSFDLRELVDSDDSDATCSDIDDNMLAQGNRTSSPRQTKRLCAPGDDQLQWEAQMQAIQDEDADDDMPLA